MKQQHQYRLPAEWEKHKATIIGWPSNKSDWPGKFSPIQWVYAEIVKKIAPYEDVIIFTRDEKQKEDAIRALTKNYVPLENIRFIIQPTDRGWMRDACPAFVIENETDDRKAIHFRFNGWAKYDNWKLDQNIPAASARNLKRKLVRAMHNGTHVVLEGGAIDSNGKGTLLSTEECLLDPKVQVRNHGFTKEDYEAVFKTYLGIDKVIWLGKGIAGDDTHGHVDDLCRFVNDSTVLLCSEKKSKDENCRPLAENMERLQGMKTSTGKKIEVIPLPMPEPLWFDGLRLPASYANFYIANETVLVPTFNDPADRIALGIISECFPKRKVVGIHAVDLVWGLGTIHCLTHEVVL